MGTIRDQEKAVEYFNNNIIGVLIIIALLIASYFIYRELEIRRKKKLQFAILAFQSHTNPHFIKNVLQAINWFILNNEKIKASDYLCDFSILMEDILRFSKQHFVKLSDKLAFLDLYLKLQHLRHEEKFDYIPMDSAHQKPNIQLSDNINPDVFLLPPLLIHPFIENAIEHGLQPKKSKGFISIDFKFIESRMICTVSDNGIGVKASKELKAKSKVKRSNIGIVNTQKRIDIINQLYGIQVAVNISELFPDEADPGTQVKISFQFPLNFNPKTGFPKEIYV